VRHGAENLRRGGFPRDELGDATQGGLFVRKDGHFLAGLGVCDRHCH
jgi:hypothetical protein